MSAYSGILTLKVLAYVSRSMLEYIEQGNTTWLSGEKITFPAVSTVLKARPLMQLGDISPDGSQSVLRR
jgi:hypothetical protein